MKKLLAFLLMFTMFIGSGSMVNACGSKKENGNAKNGHVKKRNCGVQKTKVVYITKVVRVAAVSTTKAKSVKKSSKKCKTNKNRKHRRGVHYRKSLRSTIIAHRTYKHRHSVVRKRYRQSNVRISKQIKAVKYRKAVRQRKTIRYHKVVGQSSCGMHSNCHGTDPHGYSKTSKANVTCGCANLSKAEVVKLAVKGGGARMSCGMHSNCHGDVTKAHRNIKLPKPKGTIKTGKIIDKAVKPKTAPKVLVFRDSTCEHCRKITPQIESVEKSYRGKILFVNYNNTMNDKKSWMLAEHYGLDQVPAVVFINSNGVVADKFTGYRDDAAKYMSNAIDKLLK